MGADSLVSCLNKQLSEYSVFYHIGISHIQTRATYLTFFHPGRVREGEGEGFLETCG